MTQKQDNGKLVKHGGSGSAYANHKCRCDDCTRANTKRVYRRRSERSEEPKDPNDPRHGTPSFYNNHGCRCDPCKEAWSDQCKRQYRQRKESKQVKSQLEDSHEINNVIKEDQT